MRWITDLWFRLRAILAWGKMQEELDEEMAFHLEMETKKLVESGMPEVEAGKQALRSFGNVTRERERAQESWGVRLVQDAKWDMRLTFRMLRRKPGFAAVAMLTLALGIGATTAIFSVINGVLLKPLPLRDPDGLVAVWHTMPGIGLDQMALTRATYFTFRDENRVFEDIAVWRTPAVTVTGLAEPERVEVLLVTDGLLPLIGAGPTLGRAFTAEDDLPDSPTTLMLSYGYWQSRFGGDPDVIGRLLTVNGQPLEIIGVLRQDFRFPFSNPSLLAPLKLDRSRSVVGAFNYYAIARLRPGVMLEEARADLARLIPVAVETYPGGYTMKRVEETQLAVLIHPLKDEVVGDLGTVLWLLFGSVGIVLLIACANVANLFLVRAEGRQREIAVRSALGAGRGRVAREVLLESVTLSILGGALGLGLAFGGIRLLKALGPDTLPRLDEITLEPVVLFFTLAVSILAAALFGSFPIVRYGSPNLVSSLKEGGRGGGEGRQRHRARSGLVISQVALALVLLIGSGLMIRSLSALWRVHPGFERPEEVLTFRLSIPRAEVEDRAMVPHTHEQILRGIEEIPGVVSVGLSTSLPMDRRGSTNMTHVQGLTEDSPPSRRYKFVSENYFETMEIPLLAGRTYTWADIHARRPVAVVNERFAREYWGDPAAAIGKQIAQSLQGGWREVIGVVGNVRDDGPDREPRVIVYWPMALENFWGTDTLVWRSMAYAVRVSGVEPLNLLDRTRETVWAVNPNLPLAGVRTQKAIVEGRTARTSFTMLLLSIAAGVALLLGIVGLYGVISYAVSTRTREIGIRMAMGARHQQVTRMVLRRGLGLAAIGVAVGLAAAVGLTRFMSALLFGVEPVDPVTYIVTSAALTAIALLATYIPARRAAGVDPTEALRWE